MAKIGHNFLDHWFSRDPRSVFVSVQPAGFGSQKNVRQDCPPRPVRYLTADQGLYFEVKRSLTSLSIEG